MTDVTLHPPPMPLQALLVALEHTRLQRDFARLCAADFAGRLIGTDGHDRAAAWLRARMEELGLVVKRFDFILDLPVLHLAAAPTFALLDAAGSPYQMLAHRRDFAEHPASADCPRPLMGQAHSWHARADVRGAWSILDTILPHEALQALGTQLAEQGALGLLLPQHPTPEGYLSKRVVAASPAALPVIAVRSGLLPDLVGERVQAQIPIQRVLARGRIVLGRLDGTNATLDHAPLIVGAHYDGVGDDLGGFRIPGAADNAAGVAVVLELARIVQQSTFRPRRPIWFVAFDGEEVQAQGSLTYARHLSAQGITPLVINVDGAARFNEAVWVEPGSGADELLAALDNAGQWLEIRLILGTVASDNRRYAAAGFPSVGVALGGGGGHTPADLPERVDSKAMQLAARLLCATIWQLAL
jgi:aminopeptidase YwaD